MSFINNEKENQDFLIYMQYFLALSLFEQLKPVSAGELGGQIQAMKQLLITRLILCCNNLMKEKNIDI